MINNEKEALYILDLLENELRQILAAKSQSVNIFDAVGMTTQEIKHSAFVARPNTRYG